MQGLFYSLVKKANGQRVSWPGKPYKHYVIPRTSDLIALDMEFAAYEGRHLRFVKVIDPNAKRQHQKQTVKVTEKVAKVPEILPTEIEVKEPNLDKLPNRTHKEAHREKQELAYELDPIRRSSGFDMLKNKFTKRQLFDWIKKVRKLEVRYDDTVNKSEYVSIALHGFSKEMNKAQYKFQTYKYVDRWYTKKVLEDLFHEKGVKLPTGKKVGELREIAWSKGWLQRDPSDVMHDVKLPEAK